jgi:hypothetical protein
MIFGLPYVMGEGGHWAFPCGMTAEATSFAFQWLAYLGERAKLMKCDDRLVNAAQGQADFLATYLGDDPPHHIGAGGSTANQRVRASGYKLPSGQGDDNTVESMTHVWLDPATQMDRIVGDLMAHEGHHDHLWGIGFWEPNVFYGVGFAKDTELGGWYFVIEICPPEEA